MRFVRISGSFWTRRYKIPVSAEIERISMMEYNMMSVSFSSICGPAWNSAKNQDKRATLESNVFNETAAEAKPEYHPINSVRSHLINQSAHESFASIINASNCANANNAEILEDYLTFTRQGSFMRSYMY